MFDDRDGPPNVGHFIIALDPERLSDGLFAPRMRALATEFSRDESVRMPGSRRLIARARAAKEGLLIASSLHAEIVAIGRGAVTS